MVWLLVQHQLISFQGSDSYRVSVITTISVWVSIVTSIVPWLSFGISISFSYWLSIGRSLSSVVSISTISVWISTIVSTPTVPWFGFSVSFWFSIGGSLSSIVSISVSIWVSVSISTIAITIPWIRFGLRLC